MQDLQNVVAVEATEVAAMVVVVAAGETTAVSMLLLRPRFVSLWGEFLQS